MRSGKDLKKAADNLVDKFYRYGTLSNSELLELFSIVGNYELLIQAGQATLKAVDDAHQQHPFIDYPYAHVRMVVKEMALYEDVASS